MKIPPIKNVPPDVQEIMEYTRLRNKHKTIDEELRNKFRISHDTITITQMHRLMQALERIENHKNSYAQTES